MQHRTIFLAIFLALFSIPLVAQDNATILRVGYPFEPNQGFDPIDQFDPNSFMFYDIIFDALVGLDTEGTVIPRLATDWTQTADSISFTLREDVVFSDGVPFNAEAAKANLDRAKAEGSSLVQGHLATVDSVTITGDFSIQLNLSRNDELLLPRLAFYSGMMVSPNAFATASESPVGAGPYTLALDEFIEGNFYAYDVNQSYWAREILEAERIEILIASSGELVNGLLAGNQDIAIVLSGLSGTIPQDQFRVESVYSTVYGVMFWDREGITLPQLSIQDVRCALSKAMNPESYATQIEGAIAQPISTLPPEGWYGHNPNAPVTTFDPNGALATLEELQIGRLEIISGTTPSTLSRLQAFSGFMAEIGVVVSPVPLNNAEYNKITANSEYAMTAVPITFDHFITFVENYMLEGGSFNPFGAVDEDIEALYAQAQALTLEEAEPLYQQISAIITERCYVKPLAISSLAVAFSQDVSADLRFRTNGHVDVRTLAFSN